MDPGISTPPLDDDVNWIRNPEVISTFSRPPLASNSPLLSNSEIENASMDTGIPPPGVTPHSILSIPVPGPEPMPEGGHCVAKLMRNVYCDGLHAQINDDGEEVGLREGAIAEGF